MIAPVSNLTETLEQFKAYFPPNPFKHGLVTLWNDKDTGELKKKAETLEGKPVTDDLLTWHLGGMARGKTKTGFIIGYLPAVSESETTAGIIDLDGKDYPEHGALEDAKHTLSRALDALDIPYYWEHSIRGNGWHCWIFSSAPILISAMRDALKACVTRAGLKPSTEVYPMGVDARSRWVVTPYSGALQDERRLGRTFLETWDEQPIPVDELDEYITRADAGILLELSHTAHTAPRTASSTADALDLHPDALPLLLEVLKQKAPNSRHDTAPAFLNLGRRCGQLEAMTEALKSAFDLWVTDGSRTQTQWSDEIERWADHIRVKGAGGRGIPYLKAEGYLFPNLPKLEDGKNKNSGYSPFSSLPLTAINPKAGITAVNGSGKKELEPSADWYIDPALIPALEWGEVLPLPALEPELPMLELELIPLPLRPWIQDLSELSGLPPEAFLAPAVSAAGCLIGRRVAVRPKRFDTSWKVTANMWGMLIGRPSSKKSFAVSEATKPLAVLERKAREAFEESQVERELEREMLEAQIKAKKKQLEDALTGSMPRKGQTVPPGNANSFKAQVLELHTALATLEQDAHPRRYLVNSSTVEKLGELLRENQNGLMVLRDEIKGFFGEMDKAGREGEKQFHLEAWNGIGSFTFDRIGRGTVYIPNMCVGVFGGIQPSVIQKYITGALEEGEGSDGFLQRFQLAVHIRRSSIGVDRTPNKEARARVYTLFEKLDALTPEDLGLETEEGEIPALGFSSAAQDLFDRWREVMETRLIGDELKDSPMLESHLGKYGSLIAALALTFHLIDVADGSAAVRGEISLEALTLACELGDFLEAHAHVTYAAETGRVAFGAYALAGMIAGGKIMHGLKLRNLMRSGWEGLPVTLEPSLGVLEACQIARVVKVMTPGAKKPTRVIVLNPALDLEQLEDSLKGGEGDG